MPYIYDATVATQDGDERRVFRHLYQARRFVKEHDVGGSYWIERVEIAKVTLDLLIDVINSNGGSYAASTEVVEERRLS